MKGAQGLNDRLKIACQEYTAQGCKDWMQAMIKAKYSPKYAHKHGWLVLAKPHVKAEISRLMAPVRGKAAYTRTIAQTELEAARTMAEEQGKPDVIVSACRAKAKLYGLETDKTEHTLVPAGPPTDPAEYERWLRTELELVHARKDAGTALAISQNASEGTRIDCEPRTGLRPSPGTIFEQDEAQEGGGGRGPGVGEEV